MPVSNLLDEDGFLLVSGRPDYETEVLRETLSGVLLVEHRNLPAQAILWLAMVIAAATLPHGEIFVPALTARVLAIVHTNFAARKLGKAVEARRDFSKALAYSSFALLLGGASWGYLLAVVMTEPTLHPASTVLGGGTLVGASLITAILAPMQRLLAPFLAGFVGAFTLALWLAHAQLFSAALIAVACLVTVFLSFAYALSGQRLLTSRALIENRMLSEELASSLAHAEFLAYRDPLTGLMNRRAFFEFAGDADRDRYVLSLDLDNFKGINDRFGHLTGDRVLVGVSKAINRTLAMLPEGDHGAVRLGGEEFALVLDLDDACRIREITENLREAIGRIAIDLGITDQATTCSIGLAAWSAGRTIDEVLCSADSALYKAKARGRNRVEVTG